MFSPESIINLSKHWPYKRGYFAVLLVLLIIESTLLVATKSTLIISLIAFLITAIFLYFIWHISRSLPKTKKNKVGIVISISCDDETEAKKIREDFVITLQRLIKSGKTGSTFQFIEVPSFHSNNIVDIEDAKNLQIKTKSHFILYGRVRVREINKQEHHFIELDGLVSHQPIKDELSKKLADEFGELLPRQVAISKENDLLSFQFASEWAHVVAKYVIGIASCLSGDLQYAEQLYTDVLGTVTSRTDSFPVFVKLRQRLPIRLFEIYEARAVSAYEKWARTHDLSEIDNLGFMLHKINYDQYERPSVAFLWSIYHFLHNRNVAESLMWLNKIHKNDRDNLWYLNQAFLYAYKGDLKTATRYYRNAITSEMTPDIISKIEDFILYIATNDPSKYQLYYCLGFFDWKAKGDVLQAAMDFEKFINSGEKSEFEKARVLASDWLIDINNEIAKNKDF